jgi:DNA-binding transcriptional LysR family regulator
MEFNQMRYFIALCETRNFTRAAQICGISQPSLSNAVRRLEQELGGPLFDRGPPVQLSTLGESIKPRFAAIIREVVEIHQLLGLHTHAASANGSASRQFMARNAGVAQPASSRK